MHLEIKQSTDRTETVSSQTIDKLYQLAFEDQNLGITSQLDATSDVQGRIEAPAAYEDAVRYLAGIDPGDTKRFQNLYINIPNQNYYVRFEDPVVSNYCMSLYGDGVGMTRTALAAVTSNADMWSSNHNGGLKQMSSDLRSQVTTLNDFQYFIGTGDSGDASQVVSGFNNATSIKFPSCTFVYNGGYTRTLIGGCKNIQTINYSNSIFVCANVNGRFDIIAGNDVIQDWDSSLLPNQTSFARIQLFNGWKKLQKIIFPEGITATHERFIGMKSLQYAEFPSTVTDLGSGWNLGRDSAHRLPCMVVKAVTPPIWSGWNPNDTSQSGRGFGWDQLPLAIYVPDNSVTAYTSITSNGTNSESVWASPDIQAVIKPMSEMPQLYRDMGTVTQEDIDRV